MHPCRPQLSVYASILVHRLGLSMRTFYFALCVCSSTTCRGLSEGEQRSAGGVTIKQSLSQSHRWSHSSKTAKCDNEARKQTELHREMSDDSERHDMQTHHNKCAPKGGWIMFFHQVVTITIEIKNKETAVVMI